MNIYGRVYEPCVGEGAISMALTPIGAVRSVTTNDIDKKRHADFHYDARITVPNFLKKGERFDWIVTNPPFSDEFAILMNVFDFGDNIAFLARISFLEPTEDRGDWLQANPPQQVIYLPRYSFRANDEGKRQTDNVTCCWLVWHKDREPRRTIIRTKSQAMVDALLRGVSNAALPH